jgi:hypothetical protein
MTFEDFIREADEKAVEIRLRPVHMPPSSKAGDVIRFYAHLYGADGSTVDYEVHGDELIKLPFSALSNEAYDASGKEPEPVDLSEVGVPAQHGHSDEPGNPNSSEEEPAAA